GSRISQEAVTASWNVATSSAPVAAYAVVSSWIEDFRTDVQAVRDSGKPALILHGTADRILPIDATARRFRRELPEAQYVEIE
ncbi:alpha/beta hydrolase, partial [Streptomyces sp. SID7982]|nr:alpha/beta hydrolase [Streptomyces sp. SID7982]